MTETFDPIRYSVITEKNPREIVMLRGSGCVWKRCRFCDYHLDKSSDEAANFALNREQLLQITGQYHKLEVINSGSFVDLDEQTIALIEEICLKKISLKFTSNVIGCTGRQFLPFGNVFRKKVLH